MNLQFYEQFILSTTKQPFQWVGNTEKKVHTKIFQLSIYLLRLRMFGVIFRNDNDDVHFALTLIYHVMQASERARLDRGFDQFV